MSTDFTIIGTNSVGSTSASVTLSVVAGAPVISYSGATGTTGFVGSVISVTPTTLNDRGAALTSCTVSPALPGGLSIDPSTCIISGTPTGESSSTAYNITATNTIGSTAANVSLTVHIPTRLAFQTSQTDRFSNTCIGPFIIGLKDNENLNFIKKSSALTVNLSDDSGGVSFFHQLSDCSGTPVALVTIPAGGSWSESVYFKTTGSGNITLTADDPSGTAFSANHTIHILDPVPDTWVGYGTTGVPTARYGHSAIWTGSEMITWGGSTGPSMNTGNRYNPVTETWGGLNINDGSTDHSSQSFRHLDRIRNDRLGRIKWSNTQFRRSL